MDLGTNEYDNRAVTAKRRQATFAEIVQEVKEAPQPVAEAPVGMTEGGIRAPDGQVYAPVAEEITPGEALSLTRSGAIVAWDACACGGYCGFLWFDPEATAA